MGSQRYRKCMRTYLISMILVVAAIGSLQAQTQTASGSHSSQTLTGPAAFTDYSKEKPGVLHKIALTDLPPPENTESVDQHPHVVPRPRDAWPQAPAGFKVELYAGGLDRPRLIRAAPNGDIFAAESNAGKIIVLRGISADGKVEQ